MAGLMLAAQSGWMRRPWGRHYPSHCYKGQEDKARPVHSGGTGSLGETLWHRALWQPLKHTSSRAHRGRTSWGKWRFVPFNSSSCRLCVLTFTALHPSIQSRLNQWLNQLCSITSVILNPINMRHFTANQYLALTMDPMTVIWNKSFSSVSFFNTADNCFELIQEAVINLLFSTWSVRNGKKTNGFWKFVLFI